MAIGDSARSVLEIESGTSMVEAAGGIAVVVLAVIGLAQHGNGFLTAIATIVLGVAVLGEGGAIAAQFSRTLSLVSGRPFSAMELGNGMTAEIAAAGAAIVLGILALVGIHPLTLLAAAVIAVGASLFLTAAALERLSEVRAQSTVQPDVARIVVQASVGGAIGAQVLAGIAAIVLGIIALVTTGGLEGDLILIGLLVLGAAVVISGTVMTGAAMRTYP